MKKLVLLCTLVFISSNLLSQNIKVCVYDKCTGEPIPGWTITLYDTGPAGPKHYDRDFLTNRDGCIDIDWAAEGDVSISVKNGESWNLLGNLNVSTTVIPITCIQVNENDNQGNPTSTSTLKETDGCNDWILNSNVISECENPSIDFCVPEDFDAGDYCYQTEIVDCETGNTVYSECGFPDFNSLFDGLPSGEYTMEFNYGCCEEDEDGEPLKCPEDPEDSMERTIKWNPSVDFGDVDFDWNAGIAGIEQLNGEDISDQGDGLLFTDDHPFPFLGEFNVGIDLDLSQISGNATEISVSLKQLEDCATGVNETTLYSETWNTSGNLPSSLAFNSVTQGYFLLSQNYKKDDTCFEVCIRAGDGNCSVEKCGIFRIADNCPWCLKNDGFDDLTFQITPNPVTDVLYLSASNESRKLSIFDISGRQIYSGKFTRSIDVSLWNSGFFFARYSDEKGTTIIEKFYKN